MTIEEEKTEFTFDELSPTAKEHAVNHFAETLWDDWHECIYEDWKERLESEGFRRPKIQFSGFWSQGDGASFAAYFSFVGEAAEKWLTDSDKELLTAKRVEWKMDGHDPGDLIIEGEIDRSGHYSHHMTMGVATHIFGFHDRESPSEEFASGFAEYVFDDILEHARDLAQEIYQDLEKEYEYLISEEHVAEMSSANDLRYNEDGELL
jgi:hypothetical protein